MCISVQFVVRSVVAVIIKLLVQAYGSDTLGNLRLRVMLRNSVNNVAVLIVTSSGGCIVSVMVRFSVSIDVVTLSLSVGRFSFLKLSTLLTSTALMNAYGSV